MRKKFKLVSIIIITIILIGCIIFYCITSCTPFRDAASISINFITALLFYVIGMKSGYSKKEQEYINDFNSIKRSIGHGERNIYEKHPNQSKIKVQEIILQSWYIIFVPLQQWSSRLLKDIQDGNINGYSMYSAISDDLNNIILEYNQADKYNKKHHLQGCYHFDAPRKLVKELSKYKNKES